MTESPDTRGDMLTSWKEVAAFFKRQVRTVQRWEREEGLPVHRHPHRRRSSVYAYPSELTAWWRAHQTTATQPEEESAADPDVPATVEFRNASKPRRRMWLAVPIAGSLLVAGAVWLIRVPTGALAAQPFPLQQLQVDGVAIAAFDDVNGDRRADAITRADSPNEMSIYFGGWPPRDARTPDVLVSAAYSEISGGTVGDVDGDGITDLVFVTVETEPASLHRTPPVFLVRGRAEWPVRLEIPRDADTLLFVDQPKNVAIGACYAPRVDLNADGLADVVLGGVDFSPPGRMSAGGVWVLFGRRHWPARVDVISDADVTFHGSHTGEALSPRCGAGDFNGDGRRDLALLALEHTLWTLRGGRGRYYVFAGRAEWPGRIEAETGAFFRLDGDGPNAQRRMPDRPLLVDVDGNGIDDLVTARPASTADSPGIVSVVFGGAQAGSTRKQMEADVVIAGRAGSQLGSELAAADFGADGASDIVVTEPDAGAVWLIAGRHQWPRRTSLEGADALRVVSLDPWSSPDSVATGDFEGDGTTEIAVATGATHEERHPQPRLAVVTPYAPLGIDIRPGQEPNFLILAPGSVLAVGVPARGPVRPQDIDVAWTKLAGVAPFETAWKDFDGDGVVDLQLYFDASKLQVREDTTRLAIVARLRNGTLAAGSDRVSVSPPAPVVRAR